MSSQHIPHRIDQNSCSHPVTNPSHNFPQHTTIHSSHSPTNIITSNNRSNDYHVRFLQHIPHRIDQQLLHTSCQQHISQHSPPPQQPTTHSSQTTIIINHDPCYQIFSINLQAPPTSPPSLRIHLQSSTTHLSSNPASNHLSLSCFQPFCFSHSCLRQLSAFPSFPVFIPHLIDILPFHRIISQRFSFTICLHFSII